MVSKFMFVAVFMVMVSLAMSENVPGQKQALIEDIAAKAAVAYVRKNVWIK